MKRTLFWILLAAATLGAIESIARIAGPRLFDDSIDAAAVLAELRAIAAGDDGVARAGNREEVIHPFLGFVSNPDSQNELVDALRGTPVSDYGFNDDKSPIQSPSPERLIVGIFGGSVAHFFSLHGIEAMRAQLQRAPRFRGRELVVVRVALAGWKQPQQLLALSYLLVLGAHFDVVISLDGFNEVTLAGISNQPKGVFPFFPRNWFQRTQGQADQRVRVAIGEIAYLRERRAEWARRFDASPWTRSAAFGLLWRIRDRDLAAAIDGAGRDLIGYRERDARYVATGPTYAYGAGHIYPDLAEVWRRSSLQMHQLAAANDIEYYHFLQPNQYVPGSKPLHPDERHGAWLADSPYRPGVETGYPLLIENGRDLAARGVAFHDLTAIFSEHDEALYHDSCCHLNERGNELLGARIGAIIAAAREPRERH